MLIRRSSASGCRRKKFLDRLWKGGDDRRGACSLDGLEICHRILSKNPIGHFSHLSNAFKSAVLECHGAHWLSAMLDHGAGDRGP